MKIAVTTPTGKVGSKVVKILQEQKDHELILLARDADKLKTEASKGAEIREGDQMNPEFVAEATKDVDALFWVNPGDMRSDNLRAHYRKLAENAAEAIKANNIGHIVFLSSIGAHLGEGTGVVDGLHDSEEILKEATKKLTILRPTMFMDNYLMSLKHIAEDSKILLPVSGQARVPMIATIDIAEAAAKMLTGPAPEEPKVVPLHGPKDYTFDEAAKIISRALGREVKHVQVSSQQMKSALTGMGASENVAEKMTELYDAINSGSIKAETPRTDQSTTPTSMEYFSTKVLAPILNK